MAHHYAVVTTRTFLPYDSRCSIKLKKAKVLPTGNCPIEEKLAYSDDCPDGRVEMGKTGHTSLLQVGECSFARTARSFGSEHPEFRESAALHARTRSRRRIAQAQQDEAATTGTAERSAVGPTRCYKGCEGWNCLMPRPSDEPPNHCAMSVGHDGRCLCFDCWHESDEEADGLAATGTKGKTPPPYGPCRLPTVNNDEAMPSGGGPAGEALAVVALRPAKATPDETETAEVLALTDTRQNCMTCRPHGRLSKAMLILETNAPLQDMLAKEQAYNGDGPDGSCSLPAAFHLQAILETACWLSCQRRRGSRRAPRPWRDLVSSDSESKKSWPTGSGNEAVTSHTDEL
jgi:hypothetical protein